LAFFGRHDVDLPAGKLGGQTHVLTTRANGFGQVFGVDHDVHGVLVLVNDDGLYVSRRQRTDDKLGRVVRPQHDVDLLAPQFVTHRSDARPAHAHAGADRVDALVVGDDGDLGAHPGIAGSRLDFEQPLLDLGDFVLEQLAKELGRGARQNDLLATGRVVDLVHPGANAVADPDVFFGDHFAAWQARLDLARFDDGVALVHALDGPRNNGLATLEEVVEHLLALGVADALQNGLLGGLRADASELFGLERLFDVLAHLNAGVDFLRVGVQLLLIGLLQARVIGHDKPAPEALVGPGLAIYGHADIGFFFEAFFHGGCQGAFQRAEDYFARHVFFTRQGVNQ